MVASRGIPLVRAASLVPFVGYLERLGAPVDRLLAEAQLAYFPYEAVERPVALLSALTFANRAAWTQGLPDLGCRVAVGDCLNQLGILGEMLQHAGTVREALGRAVVAIRRFCSHELLMLREGPAGPVLTVTFARSIDPALLPIAQQYTAMVVQRICELSGYRGQVFRRAAFHGFTRDGLEAMRAWFGDVVWPRAQPGLELTLQPGVIERPCLRRPGEAANHAAPGSWLPLGPGLGIAEATRHLVESMLFASIPTIEEVALASGMSPRTLQRRLHDEGTSYSELLDELRRHRALGEILERNTTMGALSSRLGYASQGSFTRAFRRWTAASPRSYRRQAGS